MNTAKHGGAIFSDSVLDKALVLSENAFDSNIAEIDGGVVQWLSSMKPVFDDTNTYMNNLAGYYGQIVASYPVKF